MGVLDDPFGFGSNLNFGIQDGFGLDEAPQRRSAPIRQRDTRRFGIYFIQNGLRRTRRFNNLESAERFKANARNLEGVTQVSEIFEI